MNFLTLLTCLKSGGDSTALHLLVKSMIKSDWSADIHGGGGKGEL